MDSSQQHRPVLLEEVIEALNIQPSGIYIDGTFGRGGHAAAILERLSEKGHLFATDKDPQALQEAKNRFGNDQRFEIEQGSFATLAQLAEKHHIKDKVNGILLDLGVSSPQLDDADRGFSFRHDGPLDMRMDPDSGMSAAEWIARVSEQELTQVLRDYGEERYAKRIARAIIKARDNSVIETTGQLSAIVKEANPAWEKNKDPATRSFQAIRIFINRELDDLAECLEQSLDVLAPGGRLAVISFHSLEDRMVKRFMRKHAKGDDFPLDLPVTQAQLKPRLREVGKAIKPGKTETEQNPRARSAVLRVAEKLH
ncbi:MAG: 16S rRNA (cytosine(1402)-N(4))-methyltransferase RsmH [Gammaproteobacteria bacterium]|nr:16S rRNA (cytosine(1402)-N(4))-methyltransferase RsmH [Gammaproteobacteria bacterium]MDH5594520.1 16S rRNA (cytosine(1402)-N(4))-methyltransferase RsmH [Gammaproteobacteria bacterium]